MSRDDFIKLKEGMTEAQRCAAFDYIAGALSVPVGRYHTRTRSQTVDIEGIVEMFTNACEHGRATRK